MASMLRQLLSLVFPLLCLLFFSSGTLLSRRTPEEVKGDIDSVVKKVKGNDENARALKHKLKKLKNDINSKWNTAENRDRLVNVIGTITNSIEKLQSDDPMDIANGCLDLLAGLADNLGPLSSIAPLFRIISTLIGLFGGGQVEDSIEDVVKKALKEQRDDELEAEAFGTQREFTVSKSFLDGVRKEPKQLSEMEVAALSANVPIYKGVKFIAILVQRIKKAEPTDEAGARRILTFLELLVDLCSVRDVILLDLYQLVYSAGHSPNIAAGILEVKNLGREEFKHALKDLMKGDDPKLWIMLSYLYPKGRTLQTKKIFKFFKAIGLADLPGTEKDLSGNQIISCLAYPSYCIASPDNDNIQGNYAKDSYKQECTVQLKKTAEGAYSMTVHNNRTAYLTEDYMVSSRDHEVDKLAKFSFLPVTKDKKEFYLISSLEWPDKFVYEMANDKGWMATYKGNPDTNGYQEKAFWTVSSA